jgi:hypothetical protein
MSLRRSKRGIQNHEGRSTSLGFSGIEAKPTEPSTKLARSDFSIITELVADGAVVARSSTQQRPRLRNADMTVPQEGRVPAELAASAPATGM